MAISDNNTSALLLRETASYGAAGSSTNVPAFGNFPYNADDEHAYQGAVADIQKGGQLGVGPRIMNLDSATPQVFSPAIIVMMQTPGMWKDIPSLTRIIKSLWELHAKSISGIDFGYTLNTADSLVGHDGQNISMPLNTQRSQVSPSVSWTELYGNLVWNVHYKWLMDMNHPDTQTSYLSAQAELASGADGISSIPPWLITTFSCSFMAIQPDVYGTYDRIIDAAFYTCCFPTETGNLGIKREINNHEQQERTINYKAIVQHNDNTREVGALIMKALNFHKVDYQRALTLPNVGGNLEEHGHQKSVKEAIDSFKDMVGDNYSLQNAGEETLLAAAAGVGSTS